MVWDGVHHRLVDTIDGGIAAAPLGCERGRLSRLLNGKPGVSANMTLALEDMGRGAAEHWMRMQPPDGGFGDPRNHL